MSLFDSFDLRFDRVRADPGLAVGPFYGGSLGARIGRVTGKPEVVRRLVPPQTLPRIAVAVAWQPVA
ncbi:MAG: hypothetical protein QF609_08130 [Gammaproteobacteria bacterium]|jgi:hypothetical protein|nr:hypothetical protein [Gammaproteobacteria bacterium]HJP35470.1 hypothetical protein [Gammaproteobacteria bacterium]